MERWWEGLLMWIAIGGAVLFGLYLIGRMTPESRARRDIIEIGTPEWVKVLIGVAIACVILIWLTSK